MTVVPYKGDQENKKRQVAAMFNNISHRYDLLNHLLSFGIDILWRKKAIKLIRDLKPKLILDVATGTGDLAIEACRLNPEKVIGIDISENMLAQGRAKIEKLGLNQKVILQSGDSENLQFPDNNFDAVIVAFGVRNFEDLKKGISEMFRVTRMNGKVVVIEFSKPGLFPFKQLYNLYFRYILPKIGRLVSRDKAAYTYLPESVQAFPQGKQFINILNEAGFKNTKCHPLTFGICSIYIGEK